MAQNTKSQERQEAQGQDQGQAQGQDQGQPQAANQENKWDSHGISGGSYRMQSHVDLPVKESGSDEVRYIPAFEPFYVDQEEAFKLKAEGKADFVSGEEGEVSERAQVRQDANAEYDRSKAQESDEELKSFSLELSNAAKPQSSSHGMIGPTAAASNAMPATGEAPESTDLNDDRSVVVVDDPLYDGVRGVYVDLDAKAKELGVEDEAK